MPAERDHEARYKLAAALAGGSTVVEAAKAAGLSERAAYLIKREEGFDALLEAARERLNPGTKLDPDESLALRTLRGIARDDEAPAAARVAAAKALREAALDRKKPAKPGNTLPMPAKPSGKVVDLQKWREGS
jgi:hypothetical protein